jgi:hypothetical protein
LVKPRLELKTIAVRDDGCFSVMLWDGRPCLVSVERTFDNGLPVIGGGAFDCRRSRYHKGGYETFEIIVPGHTRVLFHKGALEEHSLACVIVGESFGGFDRARKAYAQRADADDQTAILGSSAGFEEFMLLTAGIDFFRMQVTGR